MSRFHNNLNLTSNLKIAYFFASKSKKKKYFKLDKNKSKNWRSILCPTKSYIGLQNIKYVFCESNHLQVNFCFHRSDQISI